MTKKERQAYGQGVVVVILILAFISIAWYAFNRKREFLQKGGKTTSSVTLTIPRA